MPEQTSIHTEPEGRGLIVQGSPRETLRHFAFAKHNSPAFVSFVVGPEEVIWVNPKAVLYIQDASIDDA